MTIQRSSVRGVPAYAGTGVFGFERTASLARSRMLNKPRVGVGGAFRPPPVFFVCIPSLTFLTLVYSI